MEDLSFVENQSLLKSTHISEDELNYYVNSIKSSNKNNQKLLDLYCELPSNQTNQNEIVFWKKKKESLEKLLVDCNSIQDFTEEFLNLTHFKDYLSAHLLIHEKGSSNCFCFNSRKLNKTTKTKIKIGDFNKLYNIVKKSKNKSFTREQVAPADISFLGTFLAKEVSLHNHNIVLVLSRNDFLEPAKEELSYFSSFTKNIGPILNGLLQHETVNVKIITLIQCLYEYPFPLQIFKNNEVIFKNYSYKNVKNSEQLINVENFNFDKLYSITLYTHKDEETHTSDLFHFQRISLLGELLNTLRHELSNPLFGLGLASELLKGEFKHTENEELFDEVHNNVLRCQLIIENFSNLYQNLSVEKNVFLRKIIDESLTLTKSETRGIEKNVNYQKLIDENFGMKINPTWLVQILFNLIVNSAQALRAQEANTMKQITMNIFIKDNRVNIIISDNGPGINEDKIEKIFKPFYTTKPNGTGLGLPISKNLAKKMNGDLTIKLNRPNPGISFTLTLPIDRNENINH